jgi:FkbM family methyltransferase
MKMSFEALLGILLESLPDEPDIFVLQIGAGDGMMGDFLYPYLTQRQWRALLLEPHAPAFARLCSTYAGSPSVQCVQLAISDRDGQQDLYFVRDTTGLPWWADQLPSLMSDVILSHQSLIPDLRERLEVASIPCQTIESLVSSCSIDHADVVAVDAEGLDAVIVSDALKAGMNPQFLLFEHKHLAAEDRQNLQVLLRKNYTVIDGPYDTICIRNGSSAQQILLLYEWVEGP